MISNKLALFLLAFSLFGFAASSWAQSGNSGSIESVVKDPSGATGSQCHRSR